MNVLIGDLVFFSALSVSALICAYHLRPRLLLAGPRPTNPLSLAQEPASREI